MKVMVVLYSDSAIRMKVMVVLYSDSAIRMKVMVGLHSESRGSVCRSSCLLFISEYFSF